MKGIYFIVLAIGMMSIGLSCKSSVTPTTLQSDFIQKDSIIDLDSIYKEYEVSGSFLLFDEENSQYYTYNLSDIDSAYSPASTFKILNSLIQIEIATLKDEKEIMKWDGKSRNAQWDQDFNLKSAFENSTLWFYQELARRAGRDTMQFYLETVNFGNRKIGSKIDEFWIDESLKITPHQQLEFLVNVQHEKYPFSDRTYRIVKNVMIADTTNGILRAKTGWGMDGKRDVGWYVGYLEKNGSIYYFVNCIHAEAKELEKEGKADLFMQARIDITKFVLRKFVHEVH